MLKKWAAALAALALLLPVHAADPQAKPAQPPKAKAKAPAKPETSTPAETLKLPKGFQAELLYSVPKDKQGSWVNLCVDPKGRLITSDQYGSLYRITPAPIGSKGETKVEKLAVEVGMAQGLLCAFDALYVVVNGADKSGLYRVTSTKNNDTYDKVELLRKFDGGGGEHGPHAVIKHPDGKRLTIVCGNQTKLPKMDTSLVPRLWGEDHLLPRVPDGNGFMKGVLAPGGFICNVEPDGKNWELFATGFRNEYDAAYNRDGELFTFDADMEWDMNTPWYRPTRVCHVTAGSEWGWRNGSAKYREYYPDNLPPVVNIGPGSPTGVTFGYGAKFPAKYQDAFFICDWSYGKLYALHMAPKGATYKADVEEFVSGTPLPLTDVVISPVDGAMYFAIGGRKTQSGLYRVTYTGTESTAASTTKQEITAEAKLRHKLDAKGDRMEVRDAELGHPDRFVRFAARTHLERTHVEGVREEVTLPAGGPDGRLNLMLAYARMYVPCPSHPKPGADTLKAGTPAYVRKIILAELAKLDFAKLTVSQKLDYVRVLHVALHRLGLPEGEERAKLTALAEAALPTGVRPLDADLLELLVALDAPSAVAKGMKLLADAPTQEEQLDLVASLRLQKSGWTPETRAAYFGWYTKAAGYKGGNSFQGFLRLLKADAVALLSPEEKAALKPVLEAKPATGTVVTAAPRPFVKKWSLEELAPAVDKALQAKGRDFDKGRKLFAAANCFACHRYDNEGGNSGPDLTGVAGRFNTRDLLESILDPSKEVSDQYANVDILTLDGRALTGRIANHNGDSIIVNTDMLNPNAMSNVKRTDIETMKTSKLSPMPTGLLDTLTEAEAVDLIAYLMSRGDRAGELFKK